MHRVEIPALYMVEDPEKLKNWLRERCLKAQIVDLGPNLTLILEEITWSHIKYVDRGCVISVEGALEVPSGTIPISLFYATNIAGKFIKDSYIRPAIGLAFGKLYLSLLLENPSRDILERIKGRKDYYIEIPSSKGYVPRVIREALNVLYELPDGVVPVLVKRIRILPEDYRRLEEFIKEQIEKMKKEIGLRNT